MTSKRAIRRKECDGKIRHVTSDDGKAAVKRMRIASKAEGRLDVYKCQFCNGYHVGHGKNQSRF
jgi:hypothetical protein